MLVQIDEVEETVVDLAGTIPYVHGEDQTYFEHEEEQPFDDLDGIGDEEGTFHANEDNKNGNDQGERPVFYASQELVHQDGRHEHGNGNGKTIGGRHAFRCPEIKHYKKTSCTQ